MKIEEARQRIDSAMTQYGAHAGAAIDLVISEVKSDLGISTANELIDEFEIGRASCRERVYSSV